MTTTDTATVADLPLNPYKGLEPFSEQDAAFFFGRTQEIRKIKTNLQVSRLTLLIGPTGVGKTSVLRAGVARELNDEAERNRKQFGVPQLAVVVFDMWHDSPLAALSDAIQDAVVAACHNRVTKEELKARVSSAASVIAERMHQTRLPREARVFRATLQISIEVLEMEEENGEVFVILDQFEQFFLYHALSRAPGSFAAELARAINDSRLPVNFLISIREDWFARLDAFKGSINGLFDHILRIDYLNFEAAGEAIEGPVAEFNRRRDEYQQKLGRAVPRVTIEGREKDTRDENLVYAVLCDPDLAAGRNPFSELAQERGEDSVGDAREDRDGGLTTDEVEQGNGVPASALEKRLGSSALPESHRAATDGIATPFLQLVLTRLWEEDIGRKADEAEREHRMLTLKTYRRLGCAKGIIRKHVSTVMEGLQLGEREIASRIIPFLMHPEGPKIASSAEALARSADLLGTERTKVHPENVSVVLNRLTTRESGILREVGPAPGKPNIARYEVLHDVLGQALLDWQQSYVAAQTEDGIRKEEAKKRRQLHRRGKLAGLIGAVILLLVTGALSWYYDRERQTILRALTEEFSPRLDMAMAGSALEANPVVSASMLRGGETTTQAIHLQSDTVYAIAATCSVRCSDLNLQLYHGGDSIPAETQAGGVITYSFPPLEHGEYRLSLTISACEGEDTSRIDTPYARAQLWKRVFPSATESCVYAYRLYSRHPRDVVRSLLELDTSGDRQTSDNGYRDWAHRDSVRPLQPGASDSVLLNLQRGTELVVLGACDPYCRDMKLSLYHGDRALIPSGEGKDNSQPEATSDPQLRFTAQEDGEYRLEIKMSECIAAVCYYGYRLHSLNREIAALESVGENLDLIAGASPYRERMLDSLAAGADISVPLEIDDSGRYIVSAVCDYNCDEIDLRIEGELVVEEKSEPGPLQVLDFTVSEPGTHRVSVEMRQCRLAYCYFGYQINRVPDP